MEHHDHTKHPRLERRKCTWRFVAYPALLGSWKNTWSGRLSWGCKPRYVARGDGMGDFVSGNMEAHGDPAGGSSCYKGDQTKDALAAAVQWEPTSKTTL
jgi:hypothetical protein